MNKNQGKIPLMLNTGNKIQLKVPFLRVIITCMFAPIIEGFGFLRTSHNKMII